MQVYGINKRIKEIMERMNYNPSSMAKVIGVSDQTMRSLIKGRNFPSFELIIKLLSLSEDIDANWLIRGKSMQKSEESNLLMLIDSLQKTVESQNETIKRLMSQLLEKGGESADSVSAESEK